MKLISWDVLLKQFNKKHNDFYSYDESTYINGSSKMRIICPLHGEFWQAPCVHKRGSGCMKCGFLKTVNKQKVQIEEVKKRFFETHNNKYQYDWSTYKNIKTKMRMICPLHGEFWQTPGIHFRGHSCYECGLIKIGSLKSLDVDIVKERFKNIHKDKYSYDWESYKNVTSEMIIICKEHGKFKQTPHNHFAGQGCPKCVGKGLTKEELENEFRKVHFDKFIYCWDTFINHITDMKMICKEHGEFYLKPYLHKIGMNCPKCIIKSRGEEKIYNYLLINNIKFEVQKRFDDCKYRRTLPFDFYLYEHNICIEYDGIQHFEVVEQFGGKKEFKQIQFHDKIKDNYCFVKKIKLIRISYWEFDNIEQILNENLK